MGTGDCREISATHDALDAFETERIDATERTVWTTGCHSWYLDDRGMPAVWPFTFGRFREEMAEPDIAHFELL